MTCVLLITLYYVIPLDRDAFASLWLYIAGLVVVLAIVVVWQVRAILASSHPGVKGVEAIAVIGPLFLILFASTYYTLSFIGASNFNVPALTKTDALYFAMTIFATTGFGDIYGASQVARVIVMIQMLLDLLMIGVVIKVISAAVKEGRMRLGLVDKP